MSISFESIAAAASVRVADIKGTVYLSIRDLIGAVCGKDKLHAKLMWRNMSPEKKADLKDSIALYQFDGSKERPQPMLAVSDAPKMLGFLRGRKADKNRRAALEILHEFMSTRPPPDEVRSCSDDCASVAGLTIEELELQERHLKNQCTGLDVEEQTVGIMRQCYDAAVAAGASADELAQFKDMFLAQARRISRI